MSAASTYSRTTHRSLLHGSFLARSADRTLSSPPCCRLDARLRCPVGLRDYAGTVGRFFPLAAFERSACGWPTRLPLVAPASCLRSSGGVHAADGCHTRTSMSARWQCANCRFYRLSPSADRLRTSTRSGSIGTSTQCSAAWLNLSLRSARSARRLCWNINSKKFRRLERVFVYATSSVGGC